MDNTEDIFKKISGKKSANSLLKRKLSPIKNKPLELISEQPSQDLYDYFAKKINAFNSSLPEIPAPQYEIKPQLDENTGKITSFDIFVIPKEEGKEPQKVFSSNDNPKSADQTKTCSFTQPFDHNIVSMYLQKVPSKVLSIKECADFATFAAFVTEVNKDLKDNPIKFQIPASVLKTINDSAAQLGNKNGERDAAFALIEKHKASPEEINAALEAKNIHKRAQP